MNFSGMKTSTYDGGKFIDLQLLKKKQAENDYVHEFKCIDMRILMAKHDAL